MANLYLTLTASTDRTRPFATLPGGQAMTYGDLEKRSAQFANTLAALGVGPGDRVAVQVEKSIAMVMLYIGCIRAGAIFLPLNTSYTATEVAYFVGDAEPVLLICDPAKAVSLAGVAGAAGLMTLDADGCGSLADQSRDQPTTFATVHRADEDLAAILYTSGTTGRSKGAMLTHRNLASNAITLRELWQFTEDDVLVHALPIFHSHGLFVAINTVIAAGASMRFLPRFDVEQVLDALPSSTVMMGVPTFYIRLLGDLRFDRRATAGMRVFISGSAPLSAEIHREFAARTGHAILERYGMTETNMNTSNPYEGERRAGTVGFALPGIDVRITDEVTGEPIADGNVGMIEIAGPNVFAGYWKMPDKTRDEFNGRFFRSGDLGRYDSEGYLAIVGRAKDLIISGGYNIYPAEVEAALDEHPGVLESAVIGAPHRDVGEGVVAIVVAREPDVPLEIATIATALEMRLARYKQPRRYILLDALPKNAMGKVQKAQLRQTYASVFDEPNA